MNKKYLLIILLVVIILIIVVISIKVTKIDTFPVSNVAEYDNLNKQNYIESDSLNTYTNETNILSTTIANSASISSVENISLEDNNSHEEQLSSLTFYATIEEVINYKGKTSLIVKGLEENDINFRGNFTFSIKDNTLLLNSNNDNIEKDDLEIGQTILIEFTGDILESSPAQIDVTKIIIK